MAKKLYEVHADRIQTAVRYVEAEDDQEAEELFWDEMAKGGDFFRSVEAELALMDGTEIDVECACEAPNGFEEAREERAMVSEEDGAANLAMWKRIASVDVPEMRFGSIVARRWGSDKDGYQGLTVGYYAENGNFVEVAIVEVDRTDGAAEGKLKVHVWSNDTDSDPDTIVRWVGPMPRKEA